MKKKRYHFCVDFEVVINESVRVPGSEEIKPEKLEKMQQIMDAFIRHPDIMEEYHKLRFYERLINTEESGYEIGKLLKSKTFEEVMNSVGQVLPHETAAYLISLFCSIRGYEYEGTEEDYIKELDLMISLLGDLIPIGASLEETGDEIKIASSKSKENAGITSGLLVIGQLSPNGRILPLHGPGMQPFAFSGDK